MAYNIDQIISVGDTAHVQHHIDLATAVNDLDVRALTRRMPYRSGDMLIPFGGSSPIDVSMVPDAVSGTIILIDQVCSIQWARILVRTAAPASATMDIVLYNASTLSLVGTFGNVAVDSTGYKTATPGSPIAIAAPGYYVAAVRPRVATVSPGALRGIAAEGRGHSVLPWTDWDYGPEGGVQWTVSGTGAAPSSLTGSTRLTQSGNPIVVLGV